MPGKTDDDQREDQIEDDESEDQEESEDTEDTEDTESEESDESDDKPKSKSAKRISDLQSEKDKETARANKAEAALAGLKRGAGSDESGKADPATKALMAELREASLDAIYGEFPEFKEYGIDRASIEGTTRAELRTSAVALVGLIRSVKTKVRNQVLTENGLKAEPSGSNRTKPVDYASMSEEAFQKLLDSVS